MEEVRVSASHTRDRGSVEKSILNEGVVMQVLIERFWIDAQKLSDIGDHTALRVQHRKAHRIGYESFKQRHAQVIWSTL
jgi:hypothetical protein